VTVALNNRSVGLDQFDPPRIGEPGIQETLRKISMHVDSGIHLEDGPRLDVEFMDGETVTLLAGNPTTAKGSARNPLSHAQVVGKAEALLAPHGPTVARDLVRAVENLENAPDLSELLRALRAGRRGE
jgi:2-methylcitrate dehydratase PrpD